MISKVYVMRDRKAGFYGTPFFSQNDATATRDFFGFCRMPQNEYLADDLELYYVGEFDSESGEITSLRKPVFLTVCSNE